MKWYVRKGSDGGHGSKPEICVDARESQTQTTDLKNHEAGLNYGWVGMQIILLMNTAL